MFHCTGLTLQKPDNSVYVVWDILVYLLHFLFLIKRGNITESKTKCIFFFLNQCTGRVTICVAQHFKFIIVQSTKNLEVSVTLSNFLNSCFLVSSVHQRGNPLSQSRSGDIYLSEESLAASSCRCWVIDVDIVVLSAHRFLHEGFGEHLPVHLHMVLPLHKVTLCIWTNSMR